MNNIKKQIGFDRVFKVIYILMTQKKCIFCGIFLVSLCYFSFLLTELFFVVIFWIFLFGFMIFAIAFTIFAIPLINS